jgi:ribosomal protein S18 acetylase RimI-like enzyme
MSTLSLLPATAADVSVLAAMLYEAAYWRDQGQAPPLDEALQQPELARYVNGWGRAGDRGLIASVAGVPVGAAWLRRFTADDHGYGYVDDATPELSIAVAPRHRGMGIGRCLLTATLAQARLDEVAQVSLSVETDNPARRLYQQLGFRDLEAAGGAVTMVVALRASST